MEDKKDDAVNEEWADKEDKDGAVSEVLAVRKIIKDGAVNKVWADKEDIDYALIEVWIDEEGKDGAVR